VLYGFWAKLFRTGFLSLKVQTRSSVFTEREVTLCYNQDYKQQSIISTRALFLCPASSRVFCKMGSSVMIGCRSQISCRNQPKDCFLLNNTLDCMEDLNGERSSLQDCNTRVRCIWSTLYFIKYPLFLSLKLYEVTQFFLLKMLKI